MARVIGRSKRLAAGGLTVVLLAAGNLLATMAPASAQYPGGTPPPTVGGEQFFPPGTAKTGVDVLKILLVALMILIIGLALRRLARRPGSREI